MKAPCKGCEDRELGSHDRCMAYRKWRAEDKAEKERIAKERERLDSGFTRHYYDRLDRRNGYISRH